MAGELTPQMLAQSRVIAKGNRIREIQHLVAQYGGRPAQWVKKTSSSVQIDEIEYEYHWYEYPEVGRVELKRKRVE